LSRSKAFWGVTFSEGAGVGAGTTVQTDLAPFGAVALASRRAPRLETQAVG